MPLGWFNDRSSGVIRKAITSDTAAIHTLVAHLAGDLANTLGTIVVGLGYLLWLDARLTAVAVGCWIVLLVPCVLAGARGMSNSFKDHAASERELAAVTVEMVDGIKEVKNFGMTDSVFGRFETARRRHADVTMEWMKSSGVGMAIIGAATQPAATLALSAGLGYWSVHLGWTAPLTVMAFALVWVGLPEGFTSLVQIFQQLYAAVHAAQSTVEILGAEELTEPDAPARFTTDRSLVELDDVVFGYEPGVPVIKGVTLSCRPGTVTALVDPSGGGKSTLARLIARFWDVDAGADVREMDPAELMAMTSMVFQDIYLFDTSIAENVRISRPGATDEELTEAIARAGLEPVIAALPDGLDTQVGEGGLRLSGGERQRVSIARAFLKNAPVLLLDEITSALDAENESAITRALAELAAGRTVVVIAHRLSTIMNADHVYVLAGRERGGSSRVVEHGSPAELAAGGGMFVSLVEDFSQTARWSVR